jgi:septum site-determining protein MinC
LSLAAAAPAPPRPKLRLAGRSFLAFVLEPSAPVDEWLADLDDVARKSAAFFANRPVVLDLSTLRPDKAEAELLLESLKVRSVRVVAVEGIDPELLGPALAPLSAGVPSTRAIELPDGKPEAEDAATKDAATPGPVSMIVDRPVRSGQTIYFPEGDLTVIGSVSSGAEVIAGGSVHIYGALRGRAVAGATGNAAARIHCTRFHAELVAIDGNYMAAEDAPQKLVGKPVNIRLQGGSLVTQIME